MNFGGGGGIWRRYEEERRKKKKKKRMQRDSDKNRDEREREAGVKGFPFSLSLKHLDSPKSHNQRTI